jgi:rhodanese-related sulfurtransferase
MTHFYNKALKILLLVTLMAGLTAIASAADIPRVATEELKTMLGNPDLIIIDVRIERDWKASELKIKGAVWEDFMEVETWAQKYPKDKTIVLYCD